MRYSVKPYHEIFFTNVIIQKMGQCMSFNGNNSNGNNVLVIVTGCIEIILL